MIAVDTNVLLRYLLDDDPDQAALAHRLINGRRKALVTDVVLGETIWTLQGRKYRLDRRAVSEVIQGLIEESNLCFEDSQVVWQALSEYRNLIATGGQPVDFPDVLIVHKARSVALRPDGSFTGLYTFDKGAQTVKGARALD